MQTSLRTQFVHVNGVPVSDAEWLLKPLVAGLTAGAAKGAFVLVQFNCLRSFDSSAGPQQMGVPRTFPVLLLEIRCLSEAVEFLPGPAEDTGMVSESASA
jgi:hypothetical protein